MEQLFVVALLVSLCSATSPPFPSKIPLNCNETEFEIGVAMDLINEERDEGFVLKPVRTVSVIQQQSEKVHAGFIYYVEMDVIETDQHVLSGKTWKECTHDIPAHETVFGHCKGTVFIARPWRILKLLNYNCTLGTVPPSAIVSMCPDCPLLVTDINSNIKAKADHLAEQFNKDSNETHHFKVDDIERVRTQYVFGQSYLFQFTIKETECLKTQPDVNLADCKSLKDHEAHVGYCKGNTYHTPQREEIFKVTCEIYDPEDDDDHKRCGHGPDSPKTKEGQDKSHPGETEVKQEGNAEAGQGEAAPTKCEHHKHGHCRHHKGHKHHRCRHGHHHPPPHHHHHHHHHHDHDHHNDSHPHDPSHPHPHHHHHHHDHGHDHGHDHHNHTKDGSSSEEHTDKKPFEKRSKGSVQIYYPSGDQPSVPVPTIVRLPPPREHPGKRGKFGKHDNIEFPSEHSKLSTCPGEPLVELPKMIQDLLFV
ncbi:fetuin-B-like [Eleutherodactylus coqui]|uniref:fetuin-B-like n=1 Tax=Eleutherodactylus coqui TaxID=57060 RepID=UPI00346242BC